jgi:hypothetical protein
VHRRRPARPGEGVDLSLRAGGGGKQPSDYAKGYATIGDIMQQLAHALSTAFDTAGGSR